jgi:type IV pilus assembly protein PilB
MDKPLEQHAWLLKAAQQVRPETQLPPDLQIAPELTDAWMQIAGIFRLDAHGLAQAVAAHHHIPLGDLRQFQPLTANRIPEKLCRELQLVPLYLDGDTLVVAVSDPRINDDRRNRIRFAAGLQIRIVILSPDDIDTCLARLFSSNVAHSSGLTTTIDLDINKSGATDAHTVLLVKAIFRSALEKNASDIHIHPFVGGGVIRMRVDGVLRRIATIPDEKLRDISRYLRSNAGLEINPFKPQDGRMRLVAGNREVDVRLSLLPAFDGDRIVCRLLDQGRNFSLSGSRLSSIDQQTLRRLASHNVGMILLTGPTGSGKTSTLYALLSELNRVDVNIMTIENPVEYVLPGISQIQVNEKQGTTFADTLRAILRQDPDIVLIGEIRDGETARIACQAALTGHMVLSTLHTNDALGVLPRLLDLGLEPSIIADALIGMVSQRLVRTLCKQCRHPVAPPYLPQENLFHQLTGEWPGFRPSGCQKCSFTGFQGRLPIIESIEVSTQLRRAVLDGATSSASLQAAAQPTRRSMSASARDLIVSGLTTPAEVQRVIGTHFWSELAAETGTDVLPQDMTFAEDVRGGQKMQLILLSADPATTERLRNLATFDVETVADEIAAAAILDAGQRAIALVIDTRLCGNENPEAWLTRLRQSLAWSGLPALFLLADAAPELKTLLEQHAAPACDVNETDESLHQALLRLLQLRSNQTEN